ncbi:hypothetical protein [Motilimonas sp. KMU-193]|uniref:hypothetical protein n=1 Tax=Motilimonas sp. KMU-193 TaxID=3388668 RepID=UPI00396B3C57
MMITNKWHFTYGGQSKEQLLLALSAQKISCNAYTSLLFMSDRFCASETIEQVDIVEVSVQSLGFESGALFADVIKAAAKQGLSLCSLELAAYLRLHYTQQIVGTQITVATERAYSDINYPNGFYLSARADALELRGYRASDDWIWPATSLFAFVANDIQSGC